MSSVPFSRYETLFVSTFDSGRSDVSLLSTAVAVFSTFKWGLLSLSICYESSYREKKLPNKTKRLVILCGSRHGLFLRQVVHDNKQTNDKKGIFWSTFPFKVIWLLLFHSLTFLYSHFPSHMVLVVAVAIYEVISPRCHHHLSFRFFLIHFRSKYKKMLFRFIY